MFLGLLRDVDLEVANTSFLPLFFGCYVELRPALENRVLVLFASFN